MKRHFSFILILFALLSIPTFAGASSLSISPSTGTFSVGSTFNVSLLLDTKGKSINALQAFLSFPADKLQVVSPSVGNSIIGVWTVAPKFNNSTGTLDLRGGIPGGIIASSGVLTNITFRVKAVGAAIIKYTDGSRVFLDDGKATDDLSYMGSAVYQFKLPPPQGPVVVSDTHPDQSVWHSNSSVTLRFENEAQGVEGFSYTLSNDPTTAPDNISEGEKNFISYTNLADGLYYFHIKALRDGVWGGVTHFAVQIDTTPPADFNLEILPNARTSSTKPVIQFNTTDAASGFDHYEIKLEPLSVDAVKTYASDDSKNFFIETVSPYIPQELVIGSYNVVVKAFDKAGNVREVTKRLAITTPFFKSIADQGVMIGNFGVLPWVWVWIILIVLVGMLGYLSYRVWYWRHKITALYEEKKLPDDILHQLEELKSYKAKYGAKMLVLVLALCVGCTFHEVHAQTSQIAPPLINTLSKDISNKEIFYIGGRTDMPHQGVVLYFQNLLNGETMSQSMTSDKDGNWFYRHNGFLSAGEYLLWAQGQSGDTMSPPSGQVKMTVKRTAIQFGSNRLSYETIYFVIIVLLLLLITALLAFIFYHYHHGRKKHRELVHHIREAEESVKRGFAMLKRDIEDELLLIRGSFAGGEMGQLEKEKEAKLLNDLNLIQKRIGKEIWEIKKESW